MYNTESAITEMRFSVSYEIMVIFMDIDNAYTQDKTPIGISAITMIKVTMTMYADNLFKEYFACPFL